MEMNIIKITDANTTGNKKLDNAINKIYTEFNKGIKASHTIARTLEKIKNEELFLAVGSSSFSDFCESRFGISKSQASRLVQISEKFLNEKVIDENGKEFYTYEEYTTSKLVEMLKATPEQLDIISPDMTVKEIRELINGKAIEEKTDPDPDDSNTDSVDTDDSTNSTNTTPDYSIALQALKDRLNNAIISDYVTSDDISAEDAFKAVLDWIDELF